MTRPRTRSLTHFKNTVRWTAGDPLVGSDARAYAAYLQTPRGDTHFVPRLQLEEYRKLAQTTRDALEAVEQEQRSLFDRALGVDDQKRAARNMLDHYRTAKTFADQLLQQAAQERKEASSAE